MIMSIADVKHATVARGNYQLYQCVMNCGAKDWGMNTVEVSDSLRRQLDESLADDWTVPAPTAVGDILASWLRLLRVDGNANCGCEETRKKMNVLGPDGCRKHIEELVNDVMKNAQDIARQMENDNPMRARILKIVNRRTTVKHTIEQAIRISRRRSDAGR